MKEVLWLKPDIINPIIRMIGRIKKGRTSIESIFFINSAKKIPRKKQFKGQRT